LTFPYLNIPDLAGSLSFIFIGKVLKKLVVALEEKSRTGDSSGAAFPP